jgi:hypothetical protein
MFLFHPNANNLQNNSNDLQHANKNMKITFQRMPKEPFLFFFLVKNKVKNKYF